MHPQHIAILRHLLQQIAVLSQVHRGGGNHLLADRVNRRVRHLGKELLEIMEQRMMRLGEHRNRRVHTHCRNGLRTILRHRQNTGLQILVSVAERLLHALSLFIGKLRYALVGNL